MSDFRKKLCDRMIKIYGFENPIIIDFCRLCEELVDNAYNDDCLELLVEAHEACPAK